MVGHPSLIMNPKPFPSFNRSATLLMLGLVVVLIGFGLRIHHLGTQSLWNDEGNSYVQAMRSFSEIADHAARDIHPPLYYWGLSVWRALTGDSEFSLRALSLFFSVGSVAVAFALGRLTVERRYAWIGGLTAALITALNSFSIYYAQETRMYAQLAFLGTLSLWFAMIFVRRPTWKTALAVMLVNTLGLYTQYAFAFMMLAQGLWVLFWMILRWREGHFPKRVLTLYFLANLGVLILFAFWLPTALEQLSIWPNTGGDTALDTAFGITLRWLIYGLSSPLATINVPLFFCLFGLLIPQQGISGESRRALIMQALMPILAILLPVGIFLLSGRFREENLKWLLPAQIAIALLMARGVVSLWSLGERARRLPKIALWVGRAGAVLGFVWLVATLWAGTQKLYTDAEYQRADYREIARVIRQNAQAGDAIILNAPNQAEVFTYYYRDSEIPIYPLPRGLGGDDVATQAEIDQVIATHEQLFAVLWGEAERDPQRIVETALNENTFELSDDWYGDVRLVRYVSESEMLNPTQTDAHFGDSIILESFALSAPPYHAGQPLLVRLNWMSDVTLETRYKIFVQLLNPEGILVAQHDSEPGGGTFLTTTWQANTRVMDTHALLIPTDAPSGDYTLIVGMYLFEEPYTRLTIQSDLLSIDTDAAQLTIIEVEPSS